MFTAVISAIVIILDQISKYVIQNNISLHNVEIIHDFFYLTYARNEGMAWSLLSGQQAFLSVVAGAAIGCMIWYIIVKNPDRMTRFSLALMIGGAAGNLIDRLFFGAVRDFLDFYIFGYDFPIFNVADSALCIGVFILMIITLKEENEEKKIS